jgi:hypothetical protein
MSRVDQMLDMRSKWDGFHRIYPGGLERDAGQLENRTEARKIDWPLTFLLRHRSQALDTLFRRGALSEPSSMKRVSLSNVACHVQSGREYPGWRSAESLVGNWIDEG